jgi:hypothetical protein
MKIMYKLKNHIQREHQDCLFDYPKGLILKLSGITKEDDVEWRTVSNEDGTYQYPCKIGEVDVYHFETLDGMSDVLNIEDVEPYNGPDNGIRIGVYRYV